MRDIDVQCGAKLFPLVRELLQVFPSVVQSAQFAAGSTNFFNTRASRPIAINRTANQEFLTLSSRRCCP